MTVNCRHVRFCLPFLFLNLMDVCMYLNNLLENIEVSARQKKRKYRIRVVHTTGVLVM